MQAHPTLVTLWFVSAAHPRTVLEAEPQADRGFARKYLAQYNPSWPLTHIGDFDMTRSAPPSTDEFYIGGYPGLSVVQTVFTDLPKISEIPEKFRTLVSATDVYAIAVSTEKGSENPANTDGVIDPITSEYGAFAHWSGGKLKRAFSATRETVFEDQGLPYPLEMPFWAGTTDATGIQLPFIPSELATAAETEWLGFALAGTNADGPEVEVPVSAFAVDGRPEVKSETKDPRSTFGRSGRNKPGKDHNAKDGVSVFDDEQGYDDYSETRTASQGTDTSNKQLAKDIVTSTGKMVGLGAKKLNSLAGKIGDEVRRRARNTDRPR